MTDASTDWDENDAAWDVANAEHDDGLHDHVHDDADAHDAAHEYQDDDDDDRD